MWRALLAKDFRRLVRNPIPWLVSLLVPLLITGLIGAAFSPRGGGGGLGVVKVAIVDEDDSLLSRVIRGMPQQSGTRSDQRVEPQLLTRPEALRRLTEGEIAAAVIIPAGFTAAYLNGDTGITLEVVKNPAQAIHPAIIEEAARIVVTGLNALRRVLGEDLREWQALLEGDRNLTATVLLAAENLRQLGARLEPVQPYLVPPLIWYETEQRDDAAAPPAPWSLFAFLLIGLTAMFLLYLADNAMRDLYRELRFRTLERFQTLHEGLILFIGGKMVYAMVVVLLGAAILLGGGAVVFGFTWHHPLALMGLVLAYAVCAAGLMGFLAAWAGRERRADMLNNLLVMGLSLAGGCMFPPDALPVFMRENIMPLLPTAWFAMAARRLQEGDASAGWILAAAKLVLLGLVALALATLLFRRRLQQGVRA